MSTEFDFRALCAELLPPLVEYDGADPYHDHRELIRRAETALDQSPAAGPTEDDFRAWWRQQAHPGTAPSPDLQQTAMAWVAFCLARWGHPAAVAQSPAAGPTDEQVADLAELFNGDPVPAIRRALELWGRPAVVAQPVSERPWERAGWCNEKGCCWMGDFGGGGFVQSWRLCKPSKSSLAWSLPWWALPLPQPRPTEQQP